MAKAKKDFSNQLNSTVAKSNEYINSILGSVEPGDVDSMTSITDENGEFMSEKDVKESLALHYYKPRKTYGKRATKQALDTMKTQGRKGIKLPRINMAFTPDNYDYIKTMAAIRGLSMSEFINMVIAKDLKENQKFYNKALQIQNDMNKQE